MKLLNINVTGFKNLKDGFNINLMTKAKVSEVDLYDEVLMIDDNLYVNTNYILTGKNSSGKTTALELIDLVYELLRLGIVRNDNFIFKNDEILLKVHFYSDGYIYLYEGNLVKPSRNIISGSDYVSFKEEKLFRKKYFKSYGKNIFDLKYDLLIGPKEMSNASILENADYSKNFSMKLDVNNPYTLSAAFDSLYSENYTDESINNIVSLFDKSIDSLSYDLKREEFTLVRGSVINKYNNNEISKILSEGTTKGIIMFSISLMTLSAGSVILIDEIENSFHKNLVEHLIMLFMDKRINKNNAQIIFTTHYAEILDIVRRSDGIFILNNDGTIDIKNLYVDYDFRLEKLKSNIVNENELDTLIKYDDIMKVKKSIINEISNSNWRKYWTSIN